MSFKNGHIPWNKNIKNYFCLDCGKKVSGKNRRCRSCSKKGNRNPAQGGHKETCKCPFCKAKRGEYKKESNPNFKGIKYFCIDCNKEITRGSKIGRCMYCANKIRNLGSKSHFWMGGLSSLKELINHSLEYDNWRKQVYEKDNYTCQGCGKKGGRLEAHHKKELDTVLKEFLNIYSQFSPLEDKETLLRLAITYSPFWNINNGETLCKNCHKLTDNYGFKYIHNKRKNNK